MLRQLKVLEIIILEHHENGWIAFKSRILKQNDGKASINVSQSFQWGRIF